MNKSQISKANDKMLENRYTFIANQRSTVVKKLIAHDNGTATIEKKPHFNKLKKQAKLLEIEMDLIEQEINRRDEPMIQETAERLRQDHENKKAP